MGFPDELIKRSHDLEGHENRMRTESRGEGKRRNKDQFADYYSVEKAQCLPEEKSF